MLDEKNEETKRSKNVMRLATVIKEQEKNEKKTKLKEKKDNETKR